METIQQRSNDGAFMCPADDAKRRAFARNFIEDFDFLLLMGLSGTGKSWFRRSCQSFQGVSGWDRDAVMNDWFDDEPRIEKFHNYLQQLEGEFIPEFLTEGRTVVVENWARFRGQRSRFLNLTEPSDDTACLVFDGPVDMIVNRCQTKKGFPRVDEDLQHYLKEKHSDIEWPLHKEGWDYIGYMTTFGQHGHDYLLQTLE